MSVCVRERERECVRETTCVREYVLYSVCASFRSVTDAVLLFLLECVCVCVRESVCACVCEREYVCERERARESVCV